MAVPGVGVIAHVDREHGVSLVCRLRSRCKLSHKGDGALGNNTEIRLSGYVPPGTLGKVNACRHLRQPSIEETIIAQWGAHV